MNEVVSPQPELSTAGGAPNSLPIERVLKVFLRFWKVLTPTVLLLAVGAAGFAYYLHQSTYTAEAWLLISDSPDVLLTPVDTDTRQSIQKQMEMIRSPRVLDPLAQKPAILETPELQNEQDVAFALGRRIVLRRRGQSDIFSVSFTSVSPEKAELVVQEVTAAYLALHARSESEQDNRIIRLLEEQRAARYEEMNQLRENVRAMSLQLLDVDPFLGESLENDLTVPRSFLQGLQERMLQYELELEILTAQIKNEEKRLAEPKTAGDSEKLSSDKLTSLKQEYATANLRLKFVQEKLKQGIKSAKQSAGASLELESLRTKLEQVTKIHNELSARILALTTARRAPYRVELYKAASLPIQADKW